MAAASNNGLPLLEGMIEWMAVGIPAEAH